jgi:hypothetical protein
MDFWKVGKKYKHLDYKGKFEVVDFTETHVVLLHTSGMEYMVPKAYRHMFMYITGV